MKKNIFITLTFAFLISVLIHFLIFDIVNKKIANAKLAYPTTNKKKDLSTKKGYSSVKFVKLKKELPKVKKEVKPTINKDVKKLLKSQQKKVVKQKPAQPKAIKLPKKREPDLKKFFTISKEDKKRLEQKEIEKKEKEKEVYDEIKELQQLDPLTQNYIKLYGEKYFTFSKEQKTYLKNNLSRIGKITQRYLTYPGLSIKTRQSGVNVIEFNFHPNGDISDVKITDSSNYTALDQNTIETIELAYKDYPKPPETIKIKIYVRYILY